MLAADIASINSAVPTVPTVQQDLLLGNGFVVLPVSEPTGGSITAAALIVSASGIADFSSTGLGSVALTCISQLRVDSPALQGTLLVHERTAAHQAG